MRSVFRGDFETEMARSCIFRMAADVQTITLKCRWHGSMRWEKPEEA